MRREFVRRPKDPNCKWTVNGFWPLTTMVLVALPCESKKPETERIWLPMVTLALKRPAFSSGGGEIAGTEVVTPLVSGEQTIIKCLGESKALETPRSRSAESGTSRVGTPVGASVVGRVSARTGGRRIWWTTPNRLPVAGREQDGNGLGVKQLGMPLVLDQYRNFGQGGIDAIGRAVAIDNVVGEKSAIVVADQQKRRYSCR